MALLHRFHDQLLHDGRITDNEVHLIEEYIHENGKLDLEDVKFLVGLLSEARDVCPAFDQILFTTIREVVLADGKVTPDEQFYLLKMLYSDGRIRENEKNFLRQLMREAAPLAPEFAALCEEALAEPVEFTPSAAGPKS